MNKVMTPLLSCCLLPAACESLFWDFSPPPPLAFWLCFRNLSVSISSQKNLCHILPGCFKVLLITAPYLTLGIKSTYTLGTIGTGIRIAVSFSKTVYKWKLIQENGHFSEKRKTLQRLYLLIA